MRAIEVRGKSTARTAVLGRIGNSEGAAIYTIDEVRSTDAGAGLPVPECNCNRASGQMPLVLRGLTSRTGSSRDVNRESG